MGLTHAGFLPGIENFMRGHYERKNRESKMDERVTPMADEPGKDTGARGAVEPLNRILANLIGHLETLIDNRPLDALALSLVVTAAENVRAATRTVDQVRRENLETSRRQAALQRYRAAETLTRRLAEAPGLALAEAKFSPEGCRCVINLWRGLSEALAHRDGWNDDQWNLARALTGCPSIAFRTTRERVALDRAHNRDRQRPRQALTATVDRVMNHYVDRLGQLLEKLAPEQKLLHEVVIATVEDKAFELSRMIGPEDREAIASLRERIQANQSGRLRWAALRGFVAGQIRTWKAFRNCQQAETGRIADAAGLESIGTAEMRKADWARKNLSAAIADFQKTLALGKSIGLPEVICPKPVKAAKKPAADEPAPMGETSAVAKVETHSVRPARAAGVKLAPVAKTASIANDDSAERRFGVQSVAAEIDAAGLAGPVRVAAGGCRLAHRAESYLPRDRHGRFLPGVIVRSPRDRQGRFLKQVSANRAGCRRCACSKSRGNCTVTQPLRATAQGRTDLRRVEPNVRTRDQAVSGPVREADSIRDGSDTLADFTENVQNDDSTRMPAPDPESESRSDLPPDFGRGLTGDGER